MEKHCSQNRLTGIIVEMQFNAVARTKNSLSFFAMSKTSGHNPLLNMCSWNAGNSEITIEKKEIACHCPNTQSSFNVTGVRRNAKHHILSNDMLAIDVNNSRTLSLTSHELSCNRFTMIGPIFCMYEPDSVSTSRARFGARKCSTESCASLSTSTANCR